MGGCLGAAAAFAAVYAAGWNKQDPTASGKVISDVIGRVDNLIKCLQSNVLPSIASMIASQNLTLLGIPLMRLMLQSALFLCFGVGTQGQTRIHGFLDLPGEVGDVSISGDGKAFAFAWRSDSVSEGLYIQSGEGTEPRLFAAPDSRGPAILPRWSPDGTLIAFMRSASPQEAALFVKPSQGGQERFLGIARRDAPTWAANGRSVIATARGNRSRPYDCQLALYPVQTAGTPEGLGVEGSSPAISPDGTRLALLFRNEIRVVPVDVGGRPTGTPTTVNRESGEVSTPVWTADGKELVYFRYDDRTRIRRVEAQADSTARFASAVEGELVSLTVSGTGELFGSILTNDVSYWKIDLVAPNSLAQKVRALPWNAGHVSLAPGGEVLAYGLEVGGGSQVEISEVDGSRPRPLRKVPFERIEYLGWSPDAREIAFTARREVSQTAPTELFVVPLAGGPERRLLSEFSSVYEAIWSWNRESLYFTASEADGRSAVWKLILASHKLIRIKEGPARDLQESKDGRFIYMIRPPLELVRVPTNGGVPENVLSDVLSLAVRDDDLYFVRQDSKPSGPQGLNLYRLDPATRSPQFVANVGFVPSTLQVSLDGRFVFMERRDPFKTHNLLIRGWR
jgi:Tol biopolymer transport system component